MLIKFKKILIAVTMILCFINIAYAEGETQQQTTNQNPCDAKEGEIYVELYEPIGSTDCIKGEGGISFLKNYISQIYVYGAGIVSIIAVFSIVIGGIQLMVSGGEQSGEVKERITKSFIGIAILLLSALILYTVNPTFYVLK